MKHTLEAVDWLGHAYAFDELVRQRARLTKGSAGYWLTMPLDDVKRCTFPVTLRRTAEYAAKMRAHGVRLGERTIRQLDNVTADRLTVVDSPALWMQVAGRGYRVLRTPLRVVTPDWVEARTAMMYGTDDYHRPRDFSPEL